MSVSDNRVAPYFEDFLVQLFFFPIFNFISHIDNIMIENFTQVPTS